MRCDTSHVILGGEDMSKLRNRARAASHANLVALPVAAFLSREILRRCDYLYLNICCISRIGLSKYSAVSILLSIFSVCSLLFSSLHFCSVLFCSVLFCSVLFSFHFFSTRFLSLHLIAFLITYYFNLDWAGLQCEGDP